MIRKQMRAVFEDGNLAKRRGKRAREDMVRYFSPDVVAQQVVSRLDEIALKLQPKVSHDAYTSDE